MFNRYTAAVYAIAILVASVFAIGVVPQQASAQISGNGRTGSNSTSNGAAAGGSTTGMSGSGYGY